MRTKRRMPDSQAPSPAKASGMRERTDSGSGPRSQAFVVARWRMSIRAVLPRMSGAGVAAGPSSRGIHVATWL